MLCSVCAEQSGNSTVCEKCWPECVHCGHPAAFGQMANPECTNCWEVRHRLPTFLISEINKEYVRELLKDG